MKMKIPPADGETKLQRVVRRWLNKYGENYDEGWRGALRDLREGGCQSGIINGLVYYRDTVRFYKRHRLEIDALLANTIKDVGVQSASELFGDKWDSDDPLGNDTLNQNLLAWFGFEETANQIAAEYNL